MIQTEDLLVYARSLASSLEDDMHWQKSEYGDGYWKAVNPTLLGRIESRATAALEFFRCYAGPDSFWTKRAEITYNTQGGHKSTESGARSIAPLLGEWAAQVEAGIISVVGSDALAEIGVVSTDVMSQVRRLLADKAVHAAAPVVLCGAALEVALRATVDARGFEMTERPSLAAYARRFRGADLITVQDMKDFEQCSGLRNEAAHGHFEQLSLERAGLMEQQTNLLLRRLSDIAPN